ncbi:MAG: hypothetical protein H0T79_08520 [Deltaproteobacteria bacterium]|nr:hypothetical protein [Deltaproteobacteria bacterium]
MNREANSRSALLALARSRRTQRALAHAFLHRHAPIPTLRASLGFMTSTARIVDNAPLANDASAPHTMALLGIAPTEGVAYIVEELGVDETPIVYRLFLRGPREGHLVPLHTWYEQGEGVESIRARIAHLQPTLVTATRTTSEAWMLSTRVVQRRALRATNDTADLPIRKYALQLVVEPVSGHGPSGKTTVTAFLRPEAALVEAWALPENRAIARVTYTGIPSGIGQSKDTMVLLTGLD